jgi:hypothetical protein
MTIIPRHTTVVEAVETRLGILVREDYYGYPQTESNLYMLDAHGDTIWFAEIAMTNDAYANRIRFSSDCSVKCCTWQGFDCEIDLNTGKLMRCEFTK